ncbi:MAG: flagellar hook-associated protein FlgK [Verrucomicrobiae bacterium]|nr:flagellar hook-associated protein FlgK [Verrucomicrobiae bacterium]
MGAISTLGLTGGLSIAAQGLSVARAAIEVTSNNVANVNTANYARQRANIQTDVSVNTSIGSQGLGAIITNIQSLRSSLLDNMIPGNISKESYLSEKSSLLSTVTTSLGQTVDNIESLAGSSDTTTTDGLQEVLDDFFNAWESLSATPSSAILRQQVQDAADAVADKLNSIADNLTTAQTTIVSTAQENTTEVNTALANIASLNEQIYNTEQGGTVTANELRDTRQQALEELSEKADIWYQEQENGTVQVRLGSSTGTLLVDGFYSGNTASAGTYKLSLVNNPTAPATVNYEWQGWTGGVSETPATLVAIANQPSTGEIAAEIEVVNKFIGDATTGLVSEYNNIASNLASLVNTQHAAGYTLENSPDYDTPGANDFFQNKTTGLPANITAANIRLSPTIAADTDLIAASSATGQPTDGQNALAIANISDSTVAALGNQTIAEYYRTCLSSLGSSLKSNDSQLTTQTLVVEQLQSQRDSVMGVSLDEETTNLIRFQQAYEANAKIISTIDEMFDTLVGMI